MEDIRRTKDGYPDSRCVPFWGKAWWEIEEYCKEHDIVFYLPPPPTGRQEMKKKEKHWLASGQNLEETAFRGQNMLLIARQRELEAQIKELEARNNLLEDDLEDANELNFKLENKLILVKIMRDGELWDAVIVPINGKTTHVSAPIITSLNDELDEDYAEIWTEVIE